MLAKSPPASLKAFTKALKQKSWEQQQWIWLIGPVDAGKTTLLQHASVHSNDILKQQDDPSIRALNTHEAVLFDIPGRYISSLHHYNHWQQLLASMGKARRHPIDKIVLTINLKHLLLQSSKQSQQLLENIRVALQSVKAAIPVHLIITHCDALAGFTDFFGQLSHEELKQSLGFELEPAESPTELQAGFNHQFARLVKRLSERLIWRLDQIKQNAIKNLVRDFPFQFEQLQTHLMGIVATIGHHSPCQLRSVHFSSHSQKNLPIDALEKPIAQAFHTQAAPPTAIKGKPQAYFLSPIIQRIITDNSPHAIKTALSWQPIAIAGVLFAVTTSFIGLSLYEFNQQVKNINIAKALTTKFQAPSSTDYNTNTLLTKLDQLEKAEKQLTKPNHLLIFNRPQLARIKNQLAHHYQRTLQIQLLPWLAHTLHDSLANKATGNLSYRFNTLKAYGMLLKPKEFNSHYINRWLSEYNRNEHKLKNQQLDSLAHHTHQLNSDAMVIAPFIDKHLIKHVQENFAQLPPSLLNYLQLRSLAPMQQLYSHEGFKKYYLTYNERNARLKQHYIHDYIHYWRNQINNAFLQKIKSLDDITHLIARLKLNSAQDSLTTIVYNTELDTLPEVTAAFKDLHTFNKDKHLKEQVIMQLTEVNHQLTSIEQASNPEKQAWEVFQNVLNKPKNPFSQLLALEKTLPKVIQQSVKQVQRVTWQYLLEQSSKHISSLWQTEILPYYNDHIAHRYPLENKAKREISLEHFNVFFGPEGKLTAFFQQYLSPLINQRAITWQAKKLQNVSLPFTAKALEQLERANIIQQMFYSKAKNYPNVRFSLTPVALPARLQKLALSLGSDAMTTESKQANMTYYFNWTGDKGATLKLIGRSGEQAQLHDNGPWAWLRLLTRFNQGTTVDTQHYHIMFDLNGMSGKYLLTAQQSVNPFIPGIINHFDLPQRLFKQA